MRSTNVAEGVAFRYFQRACTALRLTGNASVCAIDGVLNRAGIGAARICTGIVSSGGSGAARTVGVSTSVGSV